MNPQNISNRTYQKQEMGNPKSQRYSEWQVGNPKCEVETQRILTWARAWVPKGAQEEDGRKGSCALGEAKRLASRKKLVSDGPSEGSDKFRLLRFLYSTEFTCTTTEGLPAGRSGSFPGPSKFGGTVPEGRAKRRPPSLRSTGAQTWAPRSRGMLAAEARTK